MLSTIVGVVLVMVALRDMHHELFHPERAGTLSRMLGSVIWRASRRVAQRRRTVLSRAGPLMLISVGAVWLVLVALGAALIDEPHLPQDFNVNPNLPPAASEGFVTALYLSVATMTSVGSSDVTPRTTAMRLVGAAEPILGLVVITAWITWVLSMYPVLADRRTFEREVDLLRRAQPDAAAVVSETPRESVSELLRHLTSQVVRVTTQLDQTRLSYYFQSEQPALSLAAILAYVLELARAAEQHEREPLVRQFGGRLRMAVEDLLRDISDDHLGVRGSPDHILNALARDHLLEPPSPTAAVPARS